MQHRVGLHRLGAVAPALAAAYAALAALVATGHLTRLDQWSIDHVMPGMHAPGPPPTLADALVPLLHADFHTALTAAAAVVTLPAGALLSLLVVGGASLVLRRRGHDGAAAAWLAAWLAGNAVEVLCKAAIVRPALDWHGLHLAAFDSSWPSGHTIRSILDAAAVAAAWPRARPWAAAWAACSVGLLEPAGWHTASDVAGGLLLAGLIVELARRVR